MKNKLLWVVILACIICALTLTSCALFGKDEPVKADEPVTYELKGSFPEAVTYGDELDLSSLYILKKQGDYEEKIPVTKKMIVSGDTSTIGTSVVTFKYNDLTFIRTINVKYRVEFRRDNTLLDIQYVTHANEINPPYMPSDARETFMGWSPAIPLSIRDNMTFYAMYEYVIPDLPELITVEYETTLSEIELPTAAAGSWMFNDAPSTKVGFAGNTSLFSVSFILHEGDFIKSSSVAIKVEKRKLSFENLVTEFTYNGNTQIPTFDFGRFSSYKVKATFVDDGTSDHKSAGVHNYSFIIENDNFEGEISGTYVIKKPTVTVNVKSYIITRVEEVPNVEFTVEGFDQDKLSVLGLSVKKVTVTDVGDYVLDIECPNDNVELIVNKGTLTVTIAVVDINDVGYPVINFNGGTFDFGDPSVQTQGIKATYEESFEDYTFSHNPYGVWKWEKSGSLGDASADAYLYNAIFYHNNTLYEPLVYTIRITVVKKTLYFHFSGTTVDYNGLEQGVIYEIYESGNANDKGKKYEGLTVLGYNTFVDVNVIDGVVSPYLYNLTLDENNYEAVGSVNFTINRIDPPEADFSFSFEETWTDTLMLSGIKLPEGYAWIDPLTYPEVSENGIEYKVSYTPKDTNNYNVLYDSITVKINKAAGTILGVKELYETTFAPLFETPYVIKVTAGHQESELVILFEQNGVVVEPCNAGEYDVIITLPETEHYTEITVRVKLVIRKANLVIIPSALFGISSQTVTYGYSIDSLRLPTVGGKENWTWLTDAATVRDAGEYTLYARYTDPEGNYNDETIGIKLTVKKKTLRVPSAINTSFVYTGEKIVLEVAKTNYDELFTLVDNVALNVGTYKAKLVIKDEYVKNYEWSTPSLIEGDNSVVTITFNISRADNEWTEYPSASKTVWTYLDEGAEFTADAKFGEVIIEYTKDSITYTTEAPTNAGSYIARFTVKATDDYVGLSRIINFTIEKKIVDVPTSTNGNSFVYTGNALSVLFTESELYTVSDNVEINVGSYKAIITLTDSENYAWTSLENASKTVTVDFTVTQAQAVITGLELLGWIYGEKGNDPTAATNFGTVVFTYYKNGEKLDAKPTTAGEYVVKATVAATMNYKGAEESYTFTIAKAEAFITTAESYVFTYTGKEFAITGVNASHNEATVILSIEKVTNAGTYVVTVTLPETENYNATEISFTVTVKKATNTDTVNVNQYATYGDSISVLTLPGENWTWLTDSTTVGNAGTNVFTAKYTDPNENYEDRTVDVTVNVAKKNVNIPTVEDKEYNGELYVPTVPDSELYTVIENLGGTDKGRYSVTIKLNDGANYKWTAIEDDTVTVYYEIAAAVNKWESAPYISDSWFYGETPEIVGNAAFGDVKIEYSVYGENVFTETLPKNAGKYVVRFTTTDTNYTILTVSLTFTIKRQEIKVPTPDTLTFIYTGEAQIPTLATLDGIYTITFDNADSTVVSSYGITVSLIDTDNYVWVGGSDENVNYTYEIEKADAGLNAFIDGWTYGANANDPSFNAAFELSGVYLLYAGKDGVYSTTVPTTAGTYTVKAVYDGDENIERSESAAFTFTIAKASATIGGYSNTYTTEYDKNSTFVIEGITTNHYESDVIITITKDGEIVSEMFGAGVYTVTFSLPASENYEAAESVTVTVTIEKQVNKDVIETLESVYTSTLSSVLLPTSATGTWSWATPSDLVGNAGVNLHLAIFTPYDPDNYASREISVEIRVAKKVVISPVVPEANKSQVYTGTELSVGIPDTDLYTVYDGTLVEAGDYTVTIILNDPANYTWNTVEYESASVSVEFSITKAHNSWTVAPAISKNVWTFGEEAASLVGASVFGDIEVLYLVNGVNKSYDMPTTAGVHTIIISVEGTDSFTSLEARLTYTVKKVEIDIPEPDKLTFVYNGEVQKPTLATNDAYTITGTDSVNVGEYTITVALKDTLNYCWNNGMSDAITYNYTIKMAEAKISLSNANGGTYNQIDPVTATTNIGTLTVTFYDANGNKLDSMPTTVGTYTVVASVPGTANYSGDEVTKTFNITPATPVVSGYSSLESVTYQNHADLNTGALSATHAGASVDGTFTYSAINFIESTDSTAKASYVDLTFTPKDTVNYVTVSIRIYMNLKTVAKLNNSIAYGTIENALNAASSGDTVWVVPDVSGNVIIKENVTIKTGVTLVISYGMDDASRNIPDKNGKIAATVTDDNDADTEKNHVDGLTLLSKKSSVKLAAGVVLTVNGTLEISGELGAPGGGVNYTGHTAKDYAELLMDKDSKLILNANSSVICCGFIYETTLNNGSTITVENGGCLTQPYVIRDYRGGSYFYAIKDKLDDGYTTFNMFYFRNVSPKLVFNYGGKMIGIINLFASDQMNTEMATMVGSDSTSVIQLTTSESRLTAKFNPNTDVSDINIYGGAVTNGMSISIKILLSYAHTFDTSVAYFPVSYFYNITLSGDGAVYRLNQDFKFLTGSKFVVEEGVTLYAKKILILETFTDPCNIPGKYPTGLPAAEFILRGSAIIEELGGTITADSSNARLLVTKGYEATAHDVVSVSGSSFTASVGGYESITETAKLKNADGSIIVLNKNDGFIRFFYDGKEWKPSVVSFDSDGGSDVSPITLTGDVYPILSNPVKNGYIFLGWFLGETKVNTADKLLSTASHTLTAKWKAGVSVNLDADGGECSEGFILPNEQNGTYYYGTLPTPTKPGYTFLGWYYGEEMITPDTELHVIGTHTITAKWQINQSYTVTVKNTNASVSGIKNGDLIPAGTIVSVTVSYDKSNSKSYKVTDANGNTIKTTGSETSFTFTMPESDVTITVESKDNNVCVTPDTLITLADGTQVRVDSLTGNELLLVWNFYTGKYDVAPAAIVMNHGYATVNVTTLTFADGTTINTINGHGFFDTSVNAFVIINENNAKNYIGHLFVKQNGDGYTTTELVSYTVTEQYTDVWSILTAVHYNAILEGLWSLTAAEVENSPKWLMPYEIGKDMKYDEAKMQADIEKYGLYTYETFAEYCTYEEFVALGLENFKVSVAKGYITWEEILFLINIHITPAK